MLARWRTGRTGPSGSVIRSAEIWPTHNAATFVDGRLVFSR